MKKGSLIAIIIAVAVAAVIINFLPFGFNGKKEQRETINENFTQVEAETENVEIEIQPASNDAASVELTENKNGKYRLITNVKGDTLQVEVTDKRWFQWFSFDFFDSSSATLTVFLPEKTYDMIEAETDNGKITASEVAADIINMEADNGKIILNKITSSSIHTEVDNGDISLENVEGEINGKSNNGRISLKTETLDRPITMETDNGAIAIQTEKEPANATFDINVDNGHVTVFGESNYDTVIGNGDNVIKLTADNGKIVVR